MIQECVGLIADLQALAESKGLVGDELRQRISDVTTAAAQSAPVAATDSEQVATSEQQE